MIKKIYLDMDGVICECVQEFIRLSKEIGLPLTYPLTSENDNSDQRLFYAFVKHGGFATLPLMPDTKYLIDRLDEICADHGIEIEILTSVNTTNPDSVKAVTAQKTEWLAQHGINYPVNTVCISSHKGEYATPDSLLIDDSATPIESFLLHGGQTIAHINADDTITQLEQLLCL